MYGFYEERPDIGDEFTTDLEETDVIENIYCFDDDEGAWEVLGEVSGRVLICKEEAGWVQV